MNDFIDLMNDKISIFDENHNLIVANILASVVDGENILIGSGEFSVDVAFIIERKLPNNHIEKYIVIDPGFFSELDGMPACYNLKVQNLKKLNVMTPFATNNQIVKNIYVSDNSKFYDNSVDNSHNNYNYALSQYQSIIETIKSEVGKLNLPNSEIKNIEKSLSIIENELLKDQPNKGVLNTCIELLPTSVALLQSVVTLGEMVGIS